MKLTELLSAARSTTVPEIPASWGQGRTVFGGLTASLALEAARSVSGDAPLRTLQSNLIAPVLVDQPLKLTPRILRAGRSTVCTVELTQSEQVVAFVIATFSESREGRPSLTARAMPKSRPLEDTEPMPFLDGVTPAFTQHYDMRWAEGDWPYTNSDARGLKAYIRHKDDDAARLNSEHLALLYTDAFPCPSLARFNSFAPASSMTWQLDLTQATVESTLDHWFLVSDDEASAMGFSQMRGALFGPAGQLVALSTQTVLLGRPQFP